MEKFEVYIIFSKSSQKFYVGQTKNLKNRLNKHNNGLVKSTKYGKPWILIAKLSVSSRIEALALEKKIKGRGIKRYMEDNNIIFGM